jgi:hypothetical protein
MMPGRLMVLLLIGMMGGLNVLMMDWSMFIRSGMVGRS